MTEVRTCAQCGVEFQWRVDKRRENRGSFCTRVCADKAKSTTLSGENHWRWNGGRKGQAKKTWLRQYKAKHYKSHPLQHKAWAAVYRAKKSGALVNGPCEVCGSEYTQAHHADYTKPLDVVWLCRAHHLDLHQN